MECFNVCNKNKREIFPPRNIVHTDNLIRFQIRFLFTRHARNNASFSEDLIDRMEVEGYYFGRLDELFPAESWSLFSPKNIIHRRSTIVLHASFRVRAFIEFITLHVSPSALMKFLKLEVSYSFLRHLVDSSYYRIDDYILIDFFIMVFPLVFAISLIRSINRRIRKSNFKITKITKRY